MLWLAALVAAACGVGGGLVGGWLYWGLYRRRAELAAAADLEALFDRFVTERFESGIHTERPPRRPVDLPDVSKNSHSPPK